tara:strand:- start:408 stop:581 length:174 start_codon:yes stop_codon:yes gene_type:complete
MEKSKYYIIGKSIYGKEVLDTAKTYGEAVKLVYDYQLAFGNKWTIHYSTSKDLNKVK